MENDGKRPCSYPYLSPELVQEILSYLPAKSLMRFKSVCRSWRSIILDPPFARSHNRRGSSPRFLISSIFRFPGSDIDFFNVNLEDQRISVDHTFHGHQQRGIICSNQVNGLVCFYYSDDHPSYLHNIATRETVQLPAPSKGEDYRHSFHLGFDPVTKLYKLVKINCLLEYQHYSINCEILTLGDGSPWRTIDSPPWKLLLSRCECYNGVLCWDEDPEDSRIVGFDLSNERFFDFPKPTQRYKDSRLLYFGPGLSMSTRDVEECPDDKYKISKCSIISYHHHHGYNNGRGGDGVNNYLAAEVPTELKLEFPVTWFTKVKCIIGILPDGKVLMHGIEKYYCHPERVLFVYNPTHGTTETLSMDPSLVSSSSKLDAFYFKENILPLRCLIPS
ncbi:OLC1v1001847C1 [Oldenlandia corymbosa var. corymbosa]|uniref:OLC1v1001847C1 n=1 Tax=Oldenlandia corymbosa var. corymbosa TaxID=529605 RepID=A0AAV1D7F5_OLDCO|nr:OLC1v1001847C1 [Oldenlandia corymbosa var. corymbosa]